MKDMNGIPYEEYSDYRWKIVDGMAYRKDGLILPVTPENEDDFKKDINKHKKSSIYLENFLQVPEEDEQMLGYLYVILYDCVNYLNEKQIKKLIGKMKQIGQLDMVDIQNASYISAFCTSLENTFKENEVDIFYDTLEEFYKYNVPYFQQVLSQNTENKFHL